MNQGTVMFGYLLLFALIFGLIWGGLKVRKEMKMNSLTRLHKIPLRMDRREGVLAIVNYRCRAHRWDVEFVGIEGGKDIWKELTDDEKIMTNFEINSYLNHIRSELGVPY
jgi:hypothetical protein